MILCDKRDVTLVQAVIIYSTISCTTKFGVLQRENKLMSVVVFLVLYAMAIKQSYEGYSGSMERLTCNPQSSRVCCNLVGSLKFVNTYDLGVTRVVYIGV